MKNNQKNIEKRRRLYDPIQVNLPKGFRTVLNEYVSSQGESVNAYVLRLIREDMKKNSSVKLID